MVGINVLHLCSEMGFGGTEKSIETFVRNHGDQIDAQVFCIDELGVRGERLRDDGYDVRTISNARSKFEEIIESHDTDVVHVHGGFDGSGVSVEVADKLGVPAIFKSAHFGTFADGATERLIDRYFFVSQTILLRYLLLHGVRLQNDAWGDRYNVLYNPLDTSTLRTDHDYKDELGIDPEASVVGKIGRSAAEKWGGITVDAMARLYDADVDVDFVLVNAPEKIRSQIRDHGIDDAIHYVENIPLGGLSKFYNTIDVLSHSSAIGESLGYVMLEAMAHEVPVVVNSQPMRDNAQIEVVENGVRGYVANNSEAYADAILELLTSHEKRTKFGEAGKRYVESTFDPKSLTRRLESIYAEVLASKGVGGVDDTPRVKYHDMNTFSRTYSNRLDDYYGRGGLTYASEKLSWEMVTALPALRWQTWNLLRKIYIGYTEYL